MQTITKIFYLIFSLFHLTYHPIFGQAVPVPSCLIPYADKKCYKRADNSPYCRVNAMRRERYFKCDDRSFSNIILTSNNYLFIHPPFIEIFLTQSPTRIKLFFIINFFYDEPDLDVDLRSLNQIKTSFELIFITELSRLPANLMFREFKEFDLPITYDPYNYPRSWTVHWNNSNIHPTNINNINCHHLRIKEVEDGSSAPVSYTFSCPPDKCLTNQNETRVCLGSLPCLNMGMNILLCRIDRLRSNDRFNTKRSFLYADIFLTTTDTHTNTSHEFSKYLLDSCITQRLVIIVLHGRLEIPSFNSTSFICPLGLVKIISL